MIPLLQIPPGAGGPPNGFGGGQPDCFPPPCIPVGKYLPLALFITAIVLFYVGYILKNKND